VVNLTALIELVLTPAVGGTMSCPIPPGSKFSWPDVAQAEAMVDHGWAENTDAHQPPVLPGPDHD